MVPLIDNYSNLAALLDKFEAIQGMMSRLSGASFISLLQQQKRQSVTGDIVEFGVYKGKSAYILAHFIALQERLVLVDINIHPEASSILELSKGISFFHSSSREFYKRDSRKLGLRNKTRFLHVDGNHTFDNVTEDLKIAERLVARDGLVVLDDFLNPNFSQVQAATYRHLYMNKSRFSVFLLGGNKAFLCDRKHHTDWISYAISSFSVDMENAGCSIVRARTDSHPYFDAVFFRGKKPDEAAIYGQQLYGKYFQSTERH